MDRIAAMRLYARIVELSSFTAAADDLNLPRATVTHAIKQLEARLGAQLLQRTTRRVRVTRDGELYYQHCRRLLLDLDEVEANFREAASVPKGRLRVDLPGVFARLRLLPHLPEFCARHPQIELDIGTGDRFVDLLREGVDCVLRAGELGDSGMVGRQLGRLAQVTIASADYVRRHGAPRTLAELAQGHVAVNWASPTTRRVEPLDFMVGRRRREVMLPARVTVSGVDAYLGCCEVGLGIAQFPRYHVADALADGRMVELLPQFPPPSLPLTVLYPQQHQMPARLRVFIDWLVELFDAQGLE
ncbi:LysR family transcriptional regulator [Dyella sp.]|jgi:DNA-binding transcriptional LysR family regulator|uniref:LysR family transcriptional regulator n=1 Tax=Dyella sp. TaxID=1869338 RepID=UPI002D786581|nr:LysR substrate-binding domain-containing protein [Dyella sp.]HET6431782.1 LysR substrate-binding domain-containing protein [Dyella sp.]